MELSAPASGDLLWIARRLLDVAPSVGPPHSLPLHFTAVIYTDASEVAWGVVIAFGGDGWFGAWGTWDPLTALETSYFLELRAALKGLELAHDRLGLRKDASVLLCVDNLPEVQATARGCSSTALGDRLLSRIDAAASHFSVTATEWIPTDRQHADPFSRVPLDARPSCCGKADDLLSVALPLDPESRPPPDALYSSGEDARVLQLPLNSV